MIRKLGCIPRTLLATWSAVRICPTRALWRFSAIPTPALTNCFSPFRLLRKNQFPDLVRSLEDLGDDYGSVFYTNPPLCINKRQLREGFAIIDRALEIMDKPVES